MSSDSTRFRSVFEKPSGWPINGALFFLAGVCFTLSYMREVSTWMTFGLFLSVLAVAESVPPERTLLAGVVRVGGLGLVFLVAILLDFGLIVDPVA